MCVYSVYVCMHMHIDEYKNTYKFLNMYIYTCVYIYKVLDFLFQYYL